VQKRRAAARLALGVAVAASVAAAPAIAQPGPGNPGHLYVAFGDSYTSAPLVPPVDVTAPAVCGRSAANYPHLVASARGLRLRDVSCGGARVGNLTRPQYRGTVPPQFAALDPRAELVTVGIGVNDHALFGALIFSCARISVHPASSAAPCRDTFGNRFAAGIAADAAGLRAAIDRIHRLARRARVLVVGYPSLLPRAEAERRQCARAAVPFSVDDMAYIDGVERALNAMLAGVAAAAGAAFVDTYTPSLGHDMCRAPGVRWVEPPVTTTPAAPAHPTAAGEAATAAAVERALGTLSG